VAGTYVFRLTVRDDDGAADTDDVQVIVKSGTTTTTNKAPVAYAGTDFNLKLPASTATIYGKATDSDGTIASYSWAKLSGPYARLSPSGSKLVAWDLVAGSYVFRLTVKDNKGASDYDDIKIIVYN
jgi:hypothetical protein